ncbi:CDGSH iron-sulfur domain-containing protein [Streptosporangium sp. NPDC004379]|uniref:CDGSH iron-sulfur domain-containing protein n=1 Tax=Streptosporangium sp. NPDC004379 TaxID=3366189 RepID=UPI0036A475C9
MTHDRLSALLREASRLEHDIRSGKGPDLGEDVARRLRDSVITPLRRTVGGDGGPGGSGDGGSGDGVRAGGGGVDGGGAGGDGGGAGEGAGGTPSERLWILTLAATEERARAAGEADAGLQEATAALQALSLLTAAGSGGGDGGGNGGGGGGGGGGGAGSGTGADAAAERLAELRRLMAGVESGIEVAEDGPYLAANVTLYSWLGERIATCPQVALCRCGTSETKPLCDGSHSRIGFSGAKDPKRVPDRQDSYPGVGVTVLDNRGICAHSGFCTDRISSVFRLGQEPFVAPSGGRVDEIIAAVRACPSGALGLSIDGQEAREVADPVREPAVEVSKDGPYRVTGGVRLTGEGGAAVPRNQGASLEHYSLCRCGHSLNKPFCSGMHWNTSFKDPVPDPDAEVTLFEWAGGLPALTRMTRLFYGKLVPEDPLIGPLFASMSPDHPVRVAKWLGEVFGGPRAYSEGYGGYERMISQHVGRCLTEDQRARWVALMCRAADQAGVPQDAEFRAAFVAYLEWGSRIALENSQQQAQPPAHMPVPRWWWVCDATPGARVSALAVQEEKEPVALPADGEAVSYGSHIKSLFRPQDRNAMRFAFDLWSCEDVRTHAEEILKRLRGGTMPCDGAWPAEWVTAFERWVETGMAE